MLLLLFFLVFSIALFNKIVFSLPYNSPIYLIMDFDSSLLRFYLFKVILIDNIK